MPHTKGGMYLHNQLPWNCYKHTKVHRMGMHWNYMMSSQKWWDYKTMVKDKKIAPPLMFIFCTWSLMFTILFSDKNILLQALSKFISKLDNLFSKALNTFSKSRNLLAYHCSFLNSTILSNQASLNLFNSFTIKVQQFAISFSNNSFFESSFPNINNLCNLSFKFDSFTSWTFTLDSKAWICESRISRSQEACVCIIAYHILHT